MDIFDIIGPIMVGPSSSHTAGAVRIGLVTRRILGAAPVKAQLFLHGSFAATGRGHGTDRALIAGLLGYAPDDPRVPDAFTCAEQAGLDFSFSTITLRDAHPNSVKILAWKDLAEPPLEIVAASVGGGRIEVRELTGMKLAFTAEQPTLIVRNQDTPGSIADVSYILSRLSSNIATFQVTRNARGGEAIMVIETDAPIDPAMCERIQAMPGILNVIAINP